MKRRNPAIVVAAALLLVAACGGSPTAPSSEQRAVIALSGQSNADLLKPALSKYATVVGATWAGAPLSWWDRDGQMWLTLQPTLTSQVSRFVWFQGESDADFAQGVPGPLTSTYRPRLRDLIARVRQATRPNLFVIVCGMTNAPANQIEYDIMRGELQRFVAEDPNAVYISTLDLPSNNSVHLTPEGYELLAVRIATAVAPMDQAPQRVPPVLY